MAFVAKTEPWAVVNPLASLKPKTLTINPDKRQPKTDKAGKKQFGFSLWINATWGNSRRLRIRGLTLPFGPTPSLSFEGRPGIEAGDQVPMDMLESYTKLGVRARLNPEAHKDDIAALRAMGERFVSLFFQHRHKLKLASLRDESEVRGAFRSRFLLEIGDGEEADLFLPFKIKGWGDTVRNATIKAWEKEGDSGFMVDTCEYAPRFKSYRPPASPYGALKKSAPPTRFFVVLPNGTHAHELPLEEDLAAGKAPEACRRRLVGPQDLLPGCTFDLDFDPEGFDFGQKISSKTSALVITITSPGTAASKGAGGAGESDEEACMGPGGGAGSAPALAVDDDDYWGGDKVLAPFRDVAAFITGGGEAAAAAVPLPVFSTTSKPIKTAQAQPPAAAAWAGKDEDEDEDEDVSTGEEEAPPPPQPPAGKRKRAMAKEPGQSVSVSEEHEPSAPPPAPRKQSRSERQRELAGMQSPLPVSPVRYRG
jgi:hypothetical protein